MISLKLRGEAITGETYVKRQYGPVPKHILEVIKRLEKRGDIVVRPSDYHGYAKRDFIAMTKPDFSVFSPEEISIVDDVLREVCYNHTATSISLSTHDDIWRLADIGEEIPLEAAFASELSEISEDDVSKMGQAETQQDSLTAWPPSGPSESRRRLKNISKSKEAKDPLLRKSSPALSGDSNANRTHRLSSPRLQAANVSSETTLSSSNSPYSAGCIRRPRRRIPDRSR